MPNSAVPDREFLHISITASGDVYMFTDNGHWEHGLKGAEWQDPEWRDAIRVTFAQMEADCYVGWLRKDLDTMFRIPLKRGRLCTGKFGLPFVMEL